MDGKKRKITLDDWMKAVTILGEDRDIYVDGIDSIAFCGGELTPAGRKRFAKALQLPVEDGCVFSEDDGDYDEDEDGYLVDESRLVLAWELLRAFAGYVSCEDYDRYVKKEG